MDYLLCVQATTQYRTRGIRVDGCGALGFARAHCHSSLREQRLAVYGRRFGLEDGKSAVRRRSRHGAYTMGSHFQLCTPTQPQCTFAFPMQWGHG